jgi:antitoxin CptB
MYNIFVMSNKLETLKKRLVYRSSYRGTKEMDILLSSFVNKYINKLDENHLLELEDFLNFDDETIFNFYNFNIIQKKINENKISKLFKVHKI